MKATVTYTVEFTDDIFETNAKQELFEEADLKEKEEFLKNQFINLIENEIPQHYELVVNIEE